jgi:hypothetical protein
MAFSQQQIVVPYAPNVFVVSVLPYREERTAVTFSVRHWIGVGGGGAVSLVQYVAAFTYTEALYGEIVKQAFWVIVRNPSAGNWHLSLATSQGGVVLGAGSVDPPCLTITTTQNTAGTIVITAMEAWKEKQPEEEKCVGVVDQITGEVTYSGKCKVNRRPELYLGIAEMLDRVAKEKKAMKSWPTIMNTAFILNTNDKSKAVQSQSAESEDAEEAALSLDTYASPTGNSFQLPDDIS